MPHSVSSRSPSATPTLQTRTARSTVSDAAPSRGRGRASDAERPPMKLERRLQQLLSSRADPNSLCAVAPIAALDRRARRSAAHRAAARADELQERVTRGAYGVVYKVRVDRTIRSVAVWLTALAGARAPRRAGRAGRRQNRAADRRRGARRGVCGWRCTTRTCTFGCAADCVAARRCARRRAKSRFWRAIGTRTSSASTAQTSLATNWCVFTTNAGF